MAIYNASQWSIQVSVQGVGLPPSMLWDKASGGDITSSAEQYHGGGMAPSVAVPGIRTRTDCTVQVAWSDTLMPFYIALENAAGGTPASITFTPIKADRRTSAHAPFTLSGILADCNRPDADSSSSTVGELQLRIVCNEALS